MATAKERLPVTFDSLVAATNAKSHIPPGAWTLRDYTERTGYSQAYAHRKHQELVRAGAIKQGGPKRAYYWTA